ncbi:hypothetical protein GCM10027347_38030 [Larkinella harenae]
MKRFLSKQPEEFRFVNRFGGRFLKNRIRMMNQREKYRRSWPVYVFLVAVMGLVSSMAAVEKKKKAEWIKGPNKTVSKSEPSVAAHKKPTVLSSKGVRKVDEPTPEKPLTAPDSTQVTVEPAVAEVKSQSRYVVEQGDMLYWIITPKMSFNDLSELKQTVEAKTAFTFDFTQIKFDPFQVYINVLGFTISKDKGSAGSGMQGEGSDKPIKSVGGYLAAKGSLGIGEMKDDDSIGMPAALKQLAKEDEAAIGQLVEEKRIGYLIQKVQKRGLGSTTTTTGEWLRANPGRRNENLGVFIDTENRVQLYQPELAKVLINGKEIKAEEVTHLIPKFLHTVIVSDLREGSSKQEKRYVQLFLQE